MSSVFDFVSRRIIIVVDLQKSCCLMNFLLLPLLIGSYHKFTILNRKSSAIGLFILKSGLSTGILNKNTFTMATNTEAVSNQEDSQLQQITVYVPLSHADKVRAALANTNAGKLYANYDSVSFSTRGIGRFRPLAGANPAIGECGILETVEEEKIEVTLRTKDLKEAIQAILTVHPYEEPVINISPIRDYKEFLQVY